MSGCDGRGRYLPEVYDVGMQCRRRGMWTSTAVGVVFGGAIGGSRGHAGLV